MEKIRGGVLLLILANKALHDGQFPDWFAGNFVKCLKAAISKDTCGRLHMILSRVRTVKETQGKKGNLRKDRENSENQHFRFVCFQSYSVFQSYDYTFFIISQLLCVLHVYWYITIKK